MATAAATTATTRRAGDVHQLTGMTTEGRVKTLNERVGGDRLKIRVKEGNCRRASLARVARQLLHPIQFVFEWVLATHDHGPLGTTRFLGRPFRGFSCVETGLAPDWFSCVETGLAPDLATPTTILATVKVPSWTTTAR